MAKKEMTAIECIRKFIKEENLPELQRNHILEYVLRIGEHNITVIRNIDRKNLLTMEYSSMEVNGISILRLKQICKNFCNENISVTFCGNKVTFKYEENCDCTDDIRCAIAELMDTVQYFAEEVNFQMGGNVNIIDTDKRKAVEDMLKKMEEKNQEESLSGIEFKKSSNGEGLHAVAGMDDLKRQLRRDFIYTLLFEEEAKAYGVTPPNGILLYGPPGCGKTFLAERMAEESRLKYAIIKPSDLGSSYVHGSEDMIRELFHDAEKQAPCLLVFDEFDALVPSRDAAGTEYKSEEINEFLVHLNNCAERGVSVVAMTNHPERIDRAIIRKGRMDKCIYVPAPDEKTRAMIFELSLKKRLCSKNIDVKELARLTDKYSSSDISYIVQETARSCFEETLLKRCFNRKRISQADLKRTISDTLPSISATDLKRYDKIREELNDHQIIKYGRKKIGF